MNYEAGILAFLLIYVPMYFVYKNFKKNNEQADKDYQEFLRKQNGR